MESLTPFLTGLIDGTRPLPLPHPQHLSFPEDSAAIEQLANFTRIVVTQTGVRLSELEIRHLLFKLAAWCSRKGTVLEPALSTELHRLLEPLQMVLCARPGWVTSKSGVGSALRVFAQWRQEAKKLARATYADPPRIADVDWSGFYIAELTNAAHVYQEGSVLGHCMAWSVNREVLAQRGFPSGDAALDCLTYAVKIRSGELRIFSVRSPDGAPLLTISYDPKSEILDRMEGRKESPVRGPEWGSLRCDVLVALSRVVTVRRSFLRATCLLPCLRRPWCEKTFAFQAESIAEALVCNRASGAAPALEQAPDQNPQ